MMYKYLKKIIYNLWRNCLENFGLIKNFFFYRMGIDVVFKRELVGLCFLLFYFIYFFGMFLVCIVYF